MPASIIFDQATKSAGVAGEAREDFDTGLLVTCSNATVESSYTWTLVDVPIRSALVRGTIGTGSTFTFTPDVKGTYLVSLQVNGSLLSSDNARSFCAVVSFGAKTLGWRYPAAGEERAEDNLTKAGLGFPGDLNTRGWATERDLQLEQVELAAYEAANAVTTSPGVGPTNDQFVRLDPATGQFDSSVIPAGGGVTLQSAYGGGDTIALSDAQGSINVNDGSQTAATNMLTMTKTFAGAGNILDLTLGASATGDMLAGTFAGSGDSLEVDDNSGANARMLFTAASGNTIAYSAGGIIYAGLGGAFIVSGTEPTGNGEAGRNLEITGTNGSDGVGVAGGAGGRIRDFGGDGGDSDGSGAGSGGERYSKAGDGGADPILGAGAAGGNNTMLAGNGGWAGFGNAGPSGDIVIDAGQDLSGNANGGLIQLGASYARAIESGNFAETANTGTDWTHKGPVIIEAPGTVALSSTYSLRLTPQSSEPDGTVNLVRAILIDDTISSLGGSIAFLLVDADPNGQVTSGDPSSLAFNPNNGTVYKKDSNPSTWSALGAGGGGGGGGSLVLGTNSQLTTAVSGPAVVGGGVFDGSQTGTFTLRLVGRYTATGTTGDCTLRLYDWGAPGAEAAPRVLRSTLSIPFASAGPARTVTQALTANGAPGIDADEIFNTTRVYEIEIEIVGSDGGADVFKFLSGSIEVS